MAKFTTPTADTPEAFVDAAIGNLNRWRGGEGGLTFIREAKLLLERAEELALVPAPDR